MPSHTYAPPEAPDYDRFLGSPYVDPGADGFDPVTRVPGRSSVGDDGSFSYSVPIEVPDGVGGLAPGLAFSYNSRAGYGPLGVGFQLDGLSKIERCPKVLVALHAR